jgi:putative ABC transport system ATP-binding protein
MGQELAIEVRDLGRRFGPAGAERAVLDGIELRVARAEALVVLGPSGCGKTTLLNVIGGLDRGYTGAVRVFGCDLGTLDDAELADLRGRRIGFVFQAFHLLDHLSVIENVTAPSLFASQHQSEKDARRRGLEVLELVGLAERAGASPAELSGGQRQRVAIARALLRAPGLLLCDEPTGNLDRATGDQIVDLFARVHAELGTTLVVVTHEERLLRLAGRVVQLADGRIAADERAAAVRGTEP